MVDGITRKLENESGRMVMKTKPYKGTLKHPWKFGDQKKDRIMANRAVRNRSKEALRRARLDPERWDQNDFLIGVGYWD